MIAVNVVTCPCCGQSIYSRARHDFRYCNCGEVWVDGGLDYFRYPLHTEKDNLDVKTSVVTVDATREQLYLDYKKSRNLFGTLPSTDP